jgi:hypothetical protein
MGAFYLTSLCEIKSLLSAAMCFKFRHNDCSS